MSLCTGEIQRKTKSMDGSDLITNNTNNTTVIMHRKLIILEENGDKDQTNVSSFAKPGIHVPIYI